MFSGAKYSYYEVLINYHNSRKNKFFKNGDRVYVYPIGVCETIPTFYGDLMFVPSNRMDAVLFERDIVILREVTYDEYKSYTTDEVISPNIYNIDDYIPAGVYYDVR